MHNSKPKPEWQIKQELKEKYSQPIDKNDPAYLAFIKKKHFTIFEFACLLANVRPWVFDDSFESWEVIRFRVKPFMSLIKEGIRVEITDDDIPF